MNILFIGQSHWCAHLAEGINSFTDARADVMPMDRARDARNLADRGKLRDADVIVRVGFRPGAHTTRGRAFDSLFELARGRRDGQVAYFWIGTDVADSLEQAASGQDMSRFRALTDQATHVAVSYQLRDELASIGIDAQVAWMPARHVFRGSPLPPFPAAFTVLSYVPDFRHEFYGGEMLLDAARRLPQIEFRVTSGTGAWAESPPPNLRFLGRVEDMAEEFLASSSLVRMVRHDGLSNMVIEALSFGRPVVYSARLPHTRYVEFGDTDSLVAELARLAERAAPRPTSEDSADAAWAVAISDEAECYRTLVSAFTGGPGRDDYTGAGR